MFLFLGRADVRGRGLEGNIVREFYTVKGVVTGVEGMPLYLEGPKVEGRNKQRHAPAPWRRCMPLVWYWKDGRDGFPIGVGNDGYARFSSREMGFNWLSDVGHYFFGEVLYGFVDGGAGDLGDVLGGEDDFVEAFNGG